MTAWDLSCNQLSLWILTAFQWNCYTTSSVINAVSMLEAKYTWEQMEGWGSSETFVWCFVKAATSDLFRDVEHGCFYGTCSLDAPLSVDLKYWTDDSHGKVHIFVLLLKHSEVVQESHLCFLHFFVYSYTPTNALCGLNNIQIKQSLCFI